jgi:hypothetical protein
MTTKEIIDKLHLMGEINFVTRISEYCYADVSIKQRQNMWVVTQIAHDAVYDFVKGYMSGELRVYIKNHRAEISRSLKAKESNNV